MSSKDIYVLSKNSIDKKMEAEIAAPYNLFHKVSLFII